MKQSNAALIPWIMATCVFAGLAILFAIVAAIKSGESTDAKQKLADANIEIDRLNLLTSTLVPARTPSEGISDEIEFQAKRDKLSAINRRADLLLEEYAKVTRDYVGARKLWIQEGETKENPDNKKVQATGERQAIIRRKLDEIQGELRNAIF